MGLSVRGSGRVLCPKLGLLGSGNTTQMRKEYCVSIPVEHIKLPIGSPGRRNKSSTLTLIVLPPPRQIESDQRRRRHPVPSLHHK